MGETVRQPEVELKLFIAELESDTRDTAAIFNLTGLDIAVCPGAGWNTAKTEKGVLLTIDPLQVAHKPTADVIEQKGATSIIDAIIQTDRRHINYAICHELGHVRDFIDPSYENEALVSKTDNFFWNVIDDSVINRRLRRVPSLDECTDELYREVLFPTDDFKVKPKHVQLMYGLLLNTITGDIPTVNEDVQKIINGLKGVPAQGTSFNIMSVLADTSTSLEERKLIAQQFVKPYFDALYEQDKQQNPDSGEDDYGDYQNIMHGSHGDHNNDQTGKESPSGENSDDGAASPMHSAIQQAATELKKTNEQKQHPQSNTDLGHKIKANSNSTNAGGIAAELNLPETDVEDYLMELSNHRAAIKAVAKSFEKLAVPSVDLSSPRYANRAQYTGNRLHSRRLAQAAIQLKTGTEQPIWRPVELRGKRQDFNLEQLDINLLVDVSASMRGAKAAQASVTALMLMEGLELARHNLTKQHSQHKKPDIRMQVIAFGSGTEVVTPLTNDPTMQQRGKAFNALRTPDSSSTLVTDALTKVRKDSNAYPNRKQLVFIISDGDFSDSDYAKVIIESMPKQTSHIAQFVISSPYSKTIAENVNQLDQPSQVPEAVRSQLQKFMSLMGV